MNSLWNILRMALAAAIIALLLSLPLMSLLAFAFSWQQHHDLPAISKLAKETLILVPLGLPFFVPLAFAAQFGWNFWAAFAAGVVLASVTMGAWLLFGS